MNVPKYLHPSELYKTLDKDDHVPFLYKENTEINNKQDLVFLIKTLNLWDLREIPYSLFEYVHKNKEEFKIIIDDVKIEDRKIKGAFNLVLILEEFITIQKK